MLPGQLHGSFCVSSDIQKYNKCLQHRHAVVIELRWVRHQGTEYRCDLIERLPYVKCSLFSLPANDDTVSQPVKAWKRGRESAFSYPSSLAMPCAGMYLRCLPVPKATQISVSSRLTTVDTARTRISVSKVSKMILRYPLFAESTGAFWCPPLHVCMVLEMICPGELESTAHSGLMLCRRLSPQKGFLPPGVPRRRIVLLSASLKNSCQLPGIVLEGATRRRMPLPRISLALDFRLSSRYTSQMISILVTFRSCALMNGRKTCVA